jgi:branched-chain amino acid transport system permease protein
MFLQQLFNGFTIGSTYALVTIGFSLIFGVLRLMNFANGAIYMLGAYLTVVVFTGIIQNFWISLLVSIIITGAVGFSIDRFALDILRRKSAPPLAPMITTMGIATFIENAIMVFLGSRSKPVPYGASLGFITIGDARLGLFQVLILSIAIVLMLLVSFLIYRTKIGNAMLAVSQNMLAAKLMGINIRLIISCTFLLAAVLSAIAGTIVGMYYRSVSLAMSGSMGAKTSAAAMLGGIGNIPGAIVGGLCVGIIETLGAGYLNAAYRDAIAFAILILVLLIRPNGFFGKAVNRKV